MKTRALTIWQPWASLIIAGAKPFEFRKWDFRRQPQYRALIGERIVIHASVRAVHSDELRDLAYRLEKAPEETGLEPGLAISLVKKWLTAPGILPVGAGIGTVEIGEPVKAIELYGAQVADSDRIDQHVWGWPMLRPKPLRPIIPCRGQQGFWYWPTSLDAAA